jgi:hypothetical protein
LFLIGRFFKIFSSETACFLPSFGSFGKVVSEEKILEIDQSETRMACGGQVC